MWPLCLVLINLWTKEWKKLRHTGPVFYSLSQLPGLLPNLLMRVVSCFVLMKTTACRTHSTSTVRALQYYIVPVARYFVSPQNSQTHTGAVTELRFLQTGLNDLLTVDKMNDQHTILSEGSKFFFLVKDLSISAKTWRSQVHCTISSIRSGNAPLT